MHGGRGRLALWRERLLNGVDIGAGELSSIANIVVMTHREGLLENVSECARSRAEPADDGVAVARTLLGRGLVGEAEFVYW